MIRKADFSEYVNRDPSWIAWTLFFASMADASFIPLPAQTFFLVLAIMYPEKSLRYIAVATAGTMAGALIGYSAGRLVFLAPDGSFSCIAHFIFNNVPGFTEDTWRKIQELFSHSQILILFTSSFIPVPLGAFSVSAGALTINFAVFAVTVLVSQALKFFLLAFVVARVGVRIKQAVQVRIRPYRVIFQEVTRRVQIPWNPKGTYRGPRV
jgi:membrane protein YqaA with SNARE-associated domain